MSTKQVHARLFDMVEIRCGQCGKTKRLHSGQRHHLPAEIKLKKLNQCGWHVDKRLATGDRCPDCRLIDLRHELNDLDDTVPPTTPSNGHDHPPPPKILEVYNHVNSLAEVDWRENENLFVATIVAMIRQLEQIIENNFAMLRQDHRNPITSALTELIETAQLADVLTVAPTGTEQQPETEQNTVLKWLESLK